MEQNNLKVSICIPVIRMDGLRRCIDAIKKNAGIPKDQYEILWEEDIDGIGCPKMLKKIVDRSKADIVCFIGDDTLPEKDFLKHALDAMATLPDGWGVVGLNTQDINKPNGNSSAHWMAHKKMLEHIPGGNFFSTDYRHCFCDNELKDIAEELGRWVWGEKCKIIHNHPINKTAEYDNGYQKAYENGKFDHDMKTYFARKRARMQKKYGVRLAIALPLTDDKVYNQFFFSFIKVITEYMSSLVKSGKPILFDVIMPDFPCQIDAARNNLVHQALMLGCTNIIMMDTDQIYNTDNMLEKMLAHNKPVIGARVHRRYPPFDPILLFGEVGKLLPIPDDAIKPDGEFNKELQVDFTGTGCIMFDTQIFIDMVPERWFQLTTGENGQSVGEDIGFCAKLKKMGIPVIVDASIDIKHLTLLAVDWSTHKLFKKLMK